MHTRPSTLRSLLVVLATLMALAGPTRAQQVDIPDTPAGRTLQWILAFLASDYDPQAEARFAPSFLEEVPPPRLRAAHAQIRPLLAPRMNPTLIRLERNEPHALTAVYTTDAIPMPLRIGLELDPQTGLITGFLVRPAPDAAPDLADSWDELSARLEALPRQVAVGVYAIHDGAPPEPLFTWHDDRRLAVGSTFKLYILGALAEMIRDGQVSWDEPLAIRDDLKSLPSGTMQNHPAGTEFPIREYALKMIAISDNTATDHLLHLVGRERVEAFMARFHDDPLRNTPFLGTKEMFTIKLSGDPTLPERFAGADEETRREMLEGEIADAQIQMMLLPLWKNPIAIDRVEWFCTPLECARVMAHLRELARDPACEALNEILGTNPGTTIDRTRWPRVYYKGGSEPGVLNLTWLLEDTDGRAFVVTLGWNNPDAPVDVDTLLMRAADCFHLLEALRDAPAR